MRILTIEYYSSFVQTSTKGEDNNEVFYILILACVRDLSMNFNTSL